MLQANKKTASEFVQHQTNTDSLKNSKPFRVSVEARIGQTESLLTLKRAKTVHIASDNEKSGRRKKINKRSQ